MPPITHVFVTVPGPSDKDPRQTDRRVPVPPSEAAGAGGAMLILEPGKLYVLPWTTYTRKRIKGGDLELVTKDGKPAKDPAEASAPSSTKLEADGTVAKDQRTDAEINEAAAKEAAKAAIDKSPPSAKAPTFDTTDTPKGKA